VEFVKIVVVTPDLKVPTEKIMREKWKKTVRTFIFSYKQIHSSLVRTGKLSYATNKSQVLKNLQTDFVKLRNAGENDPDQYLWLRARIFSPESPLAP
jgi:hypothetical protein